MMTINALVSSDSVLIPVQAAYLPVKGLQQLIKTISMVKKRLNRKLTIETLEEKVLPEAAVAMNEKKIYQKLVRLLINLETQVQQNHVEDPEIRKTIQKLKKEVKEHGCC